MHRYRALSEVKAWHRNRSSRRHGHALLTESLYKDTSGPGRIRRMSPVPVPVQLPSPTHESSRIS